MSVDIGTSQKSDPNVVPLCDILLVLLIIFMVITPVAQKGIDINLPEQNTSEPGSKQPGGLVLTLEKDSSLKLNQETVPREILESRLRQIAQQGSQSRTIFIRADKTVPYREVLRLIDLTKGAGFDVLGVMTQPYESGGGQ
jgi:biopolymer transport protein ExbD